MTTIHPLSVVSPQARLGSDVEIGPYCTVGPDVVLGDGVRLISHVVVDGFTSLGAGCQVYPFASLGLKTQDKKYQGGAPRVEIGDRTVIREYVTVNAATADGAVTRVGADCLLMACAHVAHDCVVGDRVIMANAAMLSGHIVVEDQAIIGGITGVHQFVRIGRLSITGGCAKVTQDVPPYTMVDGNPATAHGLNSVGLKRAGLSDETQSILKKAYRLLYRSDLIPSKAVERIEQEVEPIPEIRHLVEFIRGTQRGIVK
jgi:UDP-N-acetylglucosamine acyltransferase